METVLRLKFTQHRGLKQMLLDTGDTELVEVRSSRQPPRLCTTSQRGSFLPFPFLL